MDNLEKKTASGFIYKFAERAGAQGISFIIQILLARILLPEEYGVVALVTVFITICDVFVTYGFGNSLVINKKSDKVDFSTCFYFGIVLSIVLYIIVFFAAPLIAAFYNNDALTPIIRVMGLRLPIGAVNSVQHAYVQKNMWFRKFFFATTIGTIVSGVIAVVMAYMGFGVWALVEQYMGNIIMDTICLWIIVDWRPTLDFSFKRLKYIYEYGWKILVVGLIDTVYSRLRLLVIGKVYTDEDLAFYNRGYMFPSFGMRLIEPTVNSVLFPALSNCNDDKKKMRDLTERVTQISTYIISPMMIGLMVIARPLVLVLLTDKWLPCVIYLQIGCIANLFRPQQFINNCVVKASGKSDLLLKLDIVKKAIGLVLIIISVRFGVLWIALSLIAVYFISMIINIAPNRDILGYGYIDQFKDFVKNLLPAVIMGACIYPINFLEIDPILILIMQIVAGMALYVLFSIVTRNQSFKMVLGLTKKLLTIIRNSKKKEVE